MASQCQHIMASGVRCATPPVKTHSFCYHHRRLHDTYSLPGDAIYEPEPLDSPQSITLMLHHLDLALNRQLITVREYRARLYAVQLAIKNMKSAVADPPPPSKAVVTQYTPAMRDLHRLNANQPCETISTLCDKCNAEMTIEDTMPEPEEEEEDVDELPCPLAWLQPANPDKDNGRLWQCVSDAERAIFLWLPPGQLGTLEYENQQRRMKLDKRFAWSPFPTEFQIKDEIAKIEKREFEEFPELATLRELQFTGLFQSLSSRPIPAPEPEAIKVSE
jgi:hypothetical protein